jgi:hypothetical protein
MRPKYIGDYSVGERPEPLVITFTDSTGDPLDLTAFTAKAQWRPRRSSPAMATEDAAVVTTPASGIVTYGWDADNTAIPGWHELEVWVGNGTTARYASRQFTYLVRPGLSTTAPAV